MFIASLSKEIILITVFIFTLFMKHTMPIIYKKFYLKSNKENYIPEEIRLNSID